MRRHTGSLPKKSDNPAVPVTIAEQVESTQEAFEAGATLVQHRHVNELRVAERLITGYDDRP